MNLELNQILKLLNKISGIVIRQLTKLSDVEKQIALHNLFIYGINEVLNKLEKYVKHDIKNITIDDIFTNGIFASRYGFYNQTTLDQYSLSINVAIKDSIIEIVLLETSFPIVSIESVKIIFQEEIPVDGLT